MSRLHEHQNCLRAGSFFTEMLEGFSAVYELSGCVYDIGCAGSAAIAALEQGCNAVVIECDALRASVALKRIQKAAKAN